MTRNEHSIRPIFIAHFAFLEREHGFQREDKGVAHEYVTAYSAGDVSVRVILEVPDIPFVVIQKKDGQRITSEVQLRLAMQACGGAPARWVRERDRAPIDRWVRDLHDGKYDELLGTMLRCYADEVRVQWPGVTDGTFFSGKRSRTIRDPKPLESSSH
jgi:hypothetical protein